MYNVIDISFFFGRIRSSFFDIALVSRSAFGEGIDKEIRHMVEYGFAIGAVACFAVQHTIFAKQKFDPFVLMTGEGIPCVIGVALLLCVLFFGSKLSGDMLWYVSVGLILGASCITLLGAYAYESRQLSFVASMLFMSLGVLCTGVSYAKGCNVVVMTGLIGILPAVTCCIDSFAANRSPSFLQFVLIVLVIAVASVGILEQARFKATTQSSPAEESNRAFPDTEVLKPETAQM